MSPKQKISLHFPIMKRSIAILLFLVFPVIGSCLAPFFLAGCEKEQKVEMTVPIVEVVEVIQKNVPIYSEWVGTMDGLVNATIRAQVSGYLTKQNYREGDLVRKGQVLFEVDPRPFEAALAQVKGDLARQKAAYENAKLNLARVKPLAEQNALSQKDLDDATSAELATRASVFAAKAAVQKAELDVEFTRITSPIDGIAGIAKAQIGNLVGPGATEELTTVSTVDPIKVYIQVSEQEYLKAVEGGKKHARQISLELILADGSVYPYKGELAFADRQVDVMTGTIKVAGLFPNPGNILRPGQFAKVKAERMVRQGALLVPQRSVTEMQGQYLVAVVGQDNKVNIRPIKAGERVETLWIINEGLKPKEQIVAEGVQKVKEGMTVNPKPFGDGAGEPASPENQERKAGTPAKEQR